MIVPTVGSVVWVRREHGSVDITQPEVGLILYVHKNGKINVEGFSHIGHPFTLLNLTLLQDDEPKPEGDFACWMPFQKGQAAAVEALQKQQAAIEEINKQPAHPGEPAPTEQPLVV